MSDFNFFTPISNNQTSIPHEKYHHLRRCDQLFNFGQHSVHIVNVKNNDIEVTDDTPAGKKNFSTYFGYVIKGAMIATIILPAIALIGKCIYRQANRFSIQPPSTGRDVGGVALDALFNKPKEITQTQAKVPKLPEAAAKKTEEQLLDTNPPPTLNMQRKEENAAHEGTPKPPETAETEPEPEKLITDPTPSKKQTPRTAELSRVESSEVRDVTIGLHAFLEPGEQVALSQTSKTMNTNFRAYQGRRREITYHNITDQELENLVTSASDLRTLNLVGCKNLTDNGIKLLSSLTKLKNLHLSDCNQVTDAGLKHLASLTQLESLKLIKCRQLTNEGLKEYLTSLAQLQILHLDLEGCPSLPGEITGEIIKHLTALPLHTLSFNGCLGRVTDEDLKPLSSLAKLQVLHLESCYGLSGEGLKFITALPLKELNLTRCGLSGSNLTHLASLTLLETLDLSHSIGLTDDDLQPLASLAQLRDLRLTNGSNFTDKAIEKLTCCTRLHSLNLDGCYRLTDAGLKSLTFLTELRTLDLSGALWPYSQLTDTGLKQLASLTQLRSLILKHCRLTGSGLEELTSLIKLDLHNSHVTNDGLKSLTALTKLQELDLSNCSILSDDGLNNLTTLIELQELNLADCRQVQGSGLTNLAFLEQLKDLNLSGCYYADLSQLTLPFPNHLQTLNLSQCSNLTDTILKNLVPSLTHLHILEVFFCSQLSNACIKDLAPLSNLRALNISLCKKLSDACIKDLAPLSNLNTLCLVDTNITDIGLQNFPDLSNLSTLDVSHSKYITEGEVRRLASRLQIKNAIFKISDYDRL